MNFSCETCQRRYTIADEKVRGKTVKIRCKNCQNIITVTGPAEDESTRVISTSEYHAVLAAAGSGAPAKAAPAVPARARDPWEDEPTRAAPALNPGDEWFAMLKGQQVGPLVSTALMDKMLAGEIHLRTYMWKEGMADWKRASDIPALAGVLGSATPAAPTPPAADQPPARESPSTSLGNDLFSDLESGTPAAAELGAAASQPTSSGSQAKPKGRTVTNPLQELGNVPRSGPTPTGENTRYFIAQSGMDRRNPPWKIALFVLALIGLPVGVLYALSELKVVPLEVTRVDGEGQEVKQSVFSAGGVSGLRDLLLGKTRPPARKRLRAQEERLNRTAPAKEKEAAPVLPPPKPGSPSSSDLASFYGDKSKSDVGPRIRKHSVVAAAGSSETGGPPEVEVSKVVGQTQPAFQYCIEQELKKNPNFKAGKVYLVATVGSSGAVKNAKIDRHEIDASNLGDCLKSKAKRMVFASFAGDDVDLEIPLILTSSM